MRMGLIGGRLGYRMLRLLGRRARARERLSGVAYHGRSKIESLFGPAIWREIADKLVIDFGCGPGAEAVELAERGARRVVGVDNRPDVLVQASRDAERRRVAHRCVFTTRADER